MSLASRNGVWAYARLSGEDDRQPGGTAEKLARLVRSCAEIARSAGLQLEPDHVVQERASGQSLAKRPGLQRLLDLCRADQVAYLITPYQDRLTRGDLEDEAVILRTLTLGGVTLLTSDGPPVDFAALRASDELMFGIKRALGRWYARDVGEKRARANVDRYARNCRCAGSPPYGYIRDPDAPGGYRTDPVTYPIACEILERAVHEPLNRVLRDLNARGAPTPRGAREWYLASLRGITQNLFYAGYHTPSSRARPTGRRDRIPHPERTPSGDEGAWEHPLTLDQWHELQLARNRWWKRGEPRGGLLTGLLRCEAGNTLYAAGPGYRCSCPARGDAAASHTVRRHRADAFARECVEHAIRSLPAGAVRAPRRQDPDPADVRRQHAAALKRLGAAQADLDRLIRESSLLAARFSREDFDRVVGQVTRERDAARADVDRLAQVLRVPDPARTIPLLQEVRRGGVEGMWEVLRPDEQRALVGAVLARIELSSGAPCRCLVAEYHGWLAPYGLERHAEREARLLTVPEAAAHVGRDPSSIRNWCRRGILPYTKHNGWVLIDPTALDTMHRPRRGYPRGRPRKDQ